MLENVREWGNKLLRFAASRKECLRVVKELNGFASSKWGDDMSNCRPLEAALLKSLDCKDAVLLLQHRRYRSDVMVLMDILSDYLFQNEECTRKEFYSLLECVITKLSAHLCWLASADEDTLQPRVARARDVLLGQLQLLDPAAASVLRTTALLKVRADTNSEIKSWQDDLETLGEELAVKWRGLGLFAPEALAAPRSGGASAAPPADEAAAGAVPPAAGTAPRLASLLTAALGAQDCSSSGAAGDGISRQRGLFNGGSSSGSSTDAPPLGTSINSSTGCFTTLGAPGLPALHFNPPAAAAAAAAVCPPPVPPAGAPVPPAAGGAVVLQQQQQQEQQQQQGRLGDGGSGSGGALYALPSGHSSHSGGAGC